MGFRAGGENGSGINWLGVWGGGWPGSVWGGRGGVGLVIVKGSVLSRGGGGRGVVVS